MTRPWLRLDADFMSHPKVAGLTDPAFRLYVIGLCYAHRYLTDGWLPVAVAAGTRKAATELVRAGLWETEDAAVGYVIHDYLEYQQSRAEVEAQQKRLSEAGRKGAQKRWHQP